MAKIKAYRGLGVTPIRIASQARASLNNTPNLLFLDVENKNHPANV